MLTAVILKVTLGSSNQHNDDCDNASNNVSDPNNVAELLVHTRFGQDNEFWSVAEVSVAVAGWCRNWRETMSVNAIQLNMCE